jgi:hypothetical protein
MPSISRKTQWAIDRVTGSTKPSKYDWVVLRKILRVNRPIEIRLREFQKLEAMGLGAGFNRMLSHIADAFAKGDDGVKQCLILKVGAIAQGMARGFFVHSDHKSRIIR